VQLADDATRIVTAARMFPAMPKMAALLGAGKVSLAQMGTAARQVRRLPATPAWPGPDAGSPDRDADSPDRDAGSGCDTDNADPAGPDATDGADTADGDGIGSARWGDLRAAADAILAAHAPTADAATLAAVGEQIYAAADPSGHLGDAMSRRDRRHLSISRGFEGLGEVTGRLDPEAAERAITVFDALSQRAGPDDDRTAGQRRADALDTMCTAWLQSGHLPVPDDTTPRPGRVIVTIPYHALLGLPGAPGATLAGGTPIPAETARRLSCDAAIRRVVLSPPGRCPCGHTCPFAVAGSATVASTTAAHAPAGSATDPPESGLARSNSRGSDPGTIDLGLGHLDPTAKLAAILRAAIAGAAATPRRRLHGPRCRARHPDLPPAHARRPARPIRRALHVQPLLPTRHHRPPHHPLEQRRPHLRRQRRTRLRLPPLPGSRRRVAAPKGLRRHHHRHPPTPQLARPANLLARRQTENRPTTRHLAIIGGSAGARRGTSQPTPSPR